MSRRLTLHTKNSHRCRESVAKATKFAFGMNPKADEIYVNAEQPQIPWKNARPFYSTLRRDTLSSRKSSAALRYNDPQDTKSSDFVKDILEKEAIHRSNEKWRVPEIPNRQITPEGHPSPATNSQAETQKCAENATKSCSRNVRSSQENDTREHNQQKSKKV